MDRVLLVGAEDVRAAGSNISSAADTMQRAASTIDNALERHAARVEDAQLRAEQLAGERPTLRDEFAMRAMAAMIATAAAPCMLGLDGAEEHTAKAAYKMADAMVRARVQA